MGRFVGSTALKPVGSTPDVFTKAEVFTTPGSTTWTVPSGVTSAKVFVIGAGTAYRTTSFCFQATDACSGVATPICNYCLNFVGHLPGAGGGYAEKTLTGLTAGSTMTVNVGSSGGLSASSISIGSTTVTATNGTETAVTFTCTGHTTARDNSGDNPVSLGWSLPRTGSVSCISGYFNAGGTATGGDVNRTGGRGIFIPYFCQNSCLDYSTATYAYGASSANCLKGCTCWQCQNSGYDYSFGGTRYNCNCFIAKYCAMCVCTSGNCGGCLCISADCICLITYHNVFGGQCYYNMPWSTCVCQRALADVTLCVSNPQGLVCLSAGSQQPKYLYAGQTQRDNVGAPGYDPNETNASLNTNDNVYTIPAGIGASSGRSAGNGINAYSETMELQQSNFTSASVTATGGYGTCWGSNALVCCICFGQDHFNFYFGSGISQYPWAGFCSLGEQLTTGASLSPPGRYKCVSLAYAKDQSLSATPSKSVIQLSALKSSTGGNLTDFEYGHGAGLNPAGYGAGGNRLNPSAGGGAVVIIY